MVDFKEEKIRLFGEDFILRERTAKDVMELTNFAATQKKDNNLYVYMAVRTLRDALRWNYQSIPRWRVFKRRKIKKKTSLRYLYKRLTARQLMIYQERVLKMEGLDNSKKKEMEKSSGERSQNASSPTFLK